MVRALRGACTQCASAALPARRPRQPRSAASTTTARARGLRRSASGLRPVSRALLTAHTWLHRRCGVVSPLQRRGLQWDRDRGVRAVHAARCRLKQLVRRDAAPRHRAASRHKTEGAPGAHAYGSGRAQAVSAGPRRCDMALRTAEHGGAAGCADALQRIVAICERHALLSGGGGGAAGDTLHAPHTTNTTTRPADASTGNESDARVPPDWTAPTPASTRHARCTRYSVADCHKAGEPVSVRQGAPRPCASYQRPHNSRSHGAQRGEHSDGRALRSGACPVCRAADGQRQVNSVGASCGAGRRQPRSSAPRSRRQRPRRATHRGLASGAARYLSVRRSRYGWRVRGGVSEPRRMRRATQRWRRKLRHLARGALV